MWPHWWFRFNVKGTGRSGLMMFKKKCMQYRKNQSAVFVCLVFLTSSLTTRLYRGRAPGQSVWQFYVLSHMRQSRETMTSVSAVHIILTPTQPVGSGRPQRESNPWPLHQESCALPTELPPPPPPPKSAVSSLKIIVSILRNSDGKKAIKTKFYLSHLHA